MTDVRSVTCSKHRLVAVAFLDDLQFPDGPGVCTAP